MGFGGGGRTPTKWVGRGRGGGRMKQVEGNTSRVWGGIGGRRQLVLPEDKEG